MLAPSVSDAVNLCTKDWGSVIVSRGPKWPARTVANLSILLLYPPSDPHIPLPSLNEHKSLQIGLFTLLKWQSLRAQFCWALQPITANRWKYSLGDDCDLIGRPQELADHWMKIPREWSRLSSNRIHLSAIKCFRFPERGNSYEAT